MSDVMICALTLVALAVVALCVVAIVYGRGLRSTVGREGLAVEVDAEGEKPSAKQKPRRRP